MTAESSWKQSLARKLLVIIIGSWIILAIIFGLYDLEISTALADASNPFGVFGAIYGEGPGYGIIGAALVVFIGSFISDLNKQKIPAYIFIGLSLALLTVGIIVDSHTLWKIGGFIFVFDLLVTILFRNQDWKNYRKFAGLILLLALILPILFVSITKVLCGRVRPRDVFSIGGYTPWYLPPGPDLHNASFPSGHAAMGWMLLPLLIPIRNKRFSIKCLGGVLIIGWGAFVALSRVLVGAHFASDVLFSTGVACVVTILLYKKYYLK
ncbi:MAG: phosphatase PAP2 family protein [Candidatus Helarchaeota archaeon]